MTTKRMLALVVVLASGAACSSSSPSKAKDGGADGGAAGKDGGAAGKDGGGSAGKDGSTTDVATTDGGSDTPLDMAMDVGGDTAAYTPQQARGAYLVNAVIGCPDCHTPMLPTGVPDMTMFLAGNANFVVLPNGDKLGSRNLTNDATGLKNISDADIKSFFQTGQRTVGTTTEVLNPIMPYYVFHNMTTDDADAIVAYLRTVPAVVNTIPKRGVSFDVATPANPLDPDLIPLPVDTYTNRESALRGRYLAAESGLCVECHTTHLTTGADVLDTTKLFAGGEDFSSFFATTLMIHPVSKNLTSDATTGLGTWALSDVLAALQKGQAKDGSNICPPMPIPDYMHMTIGDQTDIANYIKSLPPIVHAIADMCAFPPTPVDGGTSEAGSEAGASEAGGDTAAAGDASGN